MLRVKYNLCTILFLLLFSKPGQGGAGDFDYDSARDFKAPDIRIESKDFKVPDPVDYREIELRAKDFSRSYERSYSYRTIESWNFNPRVYDSFKIEKPRYDPWDYSYSTQGFRRQFIPKTSSPLYPIKMPERPLTEENLLHLVKKIESGGGKEKIEALRRLPEFKHFQVTGIARYALKDAAAEVRYTAVWALGEIGDKRAICLLKQLSDSDRHEMAAWAKDVLKQIRRGDPEVLEQ